MLPVHTHAAYVHTQKFAGEEQHCARENLWVREQVVEKRFHLVEIVGPPQVE